MHSSKDKSQEAKFINGCGNGCSELANQTRDCADGTSHGYGSGASIDRDGRTAGTAAEHATGTADAHCRDRWVWVPQRAEEWLPRSGRESGPPPCAGERSPAVRRSGSPPPRRRVENGVNIDMLAAQPFARP